MSIIIFPNNARADSDSNIGNCFNPAYIIKMDDLVKIISNL